MSLIMGDNKISAIRWMFDLDGTLVKTKSHLSFPRSEDDWEMNIPIVKIPKNIVIITNQCYKGERLKNMVKRVLNIINHLMVNGINVEYYISTEKDQYRKPNIGVLEYIGDRICEGATYIGDAAGRSTDHSNSDIEFAKNLKHNLSFPIHFQTPEKFMVTLIN